MLASLHTGASLGVWPSVADEAERCDVDLFCFPGGRIGLKEGHEASRNAIYGLAARVPVDGILIWTSSLSGVEHGGAVGSFLERFRGVPTVSLSSGVTGVPIVTIDYYGGMREAMRHAIECHGFRRIAFIRGPALHPGAEERYQAYLDALAEAGIELEPALVSPPFPWDSGRQALLELMDARGLEPGRDFAALVASSDLMALWAAKTLLARGWRIPEDVAVIGMNNSLESRLSTPPLTTVDGPFAELGAEGFRSLLVLLSGGEVPALRKLPASLVVRQSCGCPSPSFLLAAASAGSEAAARSREELAEMMRLELALEGGLDRDWLLPLVDAWEASVAGEQAGRFFDILGRIIDRLIRKGREVGSWQAALSMLRRWSITGLGSEALARMEDLAGQARIVLAEGAERSLAYRAWEERLRTEELRKLDRELLMAFDARHLAATLMQSLPALGIRSAYICRYEGELESERASLFFGYRDGLEVSDPSLVFPVAELVPRDLLPDRRLAFVVEPLFFHDSPIGYALFEIGPHTGSIYEDLRDAIGNALRSVILVARLEDARSRAERADEIKTRLLSNVSHELRTPVNLILSATDRLMEGSPDPDERLAIERIRANAGHQLRLVNDLLDLSRAEIDELDINRVLCDPGPLLREAFEALATNANPDLDWLLELPENLPRIMADPFRLRQILLNLLGNARNYTAEGRVSLEARVVPPNLVISVSDTGPGIPAIRLAHIFEPFISSGGGRGGVGLGLSIARHLAVLHFGSLEAESIEGAGSCFRLCLPLPSLEGLAVPATEPRSDCILVLTAGPAWPELALIAARSGLALRRLSLAEAEAGALDSIRSAAIAWEMGCAGAAEWSLFRKIRQHPRCMALPFLLYGAADQEGSGKLDATQGGAGEKGLIGLVHKASSSLSLVQTISLSCPPGGDAPLLIADDDPLALESLRATLSVAFPGIPIAEARDGEEAWQAIRDLHPRVAILDLVMPGLSGIELVELMRSDEKLYSIPVILLTNKVFASEDVRALERHSRVLLQNKGIWTDADLELGISRLLGGGEAQGAPTSALVRRTVAFLNLHYRENISRWKLAEAVSLSEDYVSRIFRRELGITPWDYLTRLRIQKAKERLMSGGESVALVAEAVGFSDQAYFSRVFRKVTGTNPAAFRAALGSKRTP